MVASCAQANGKTPMHGLFQMYFGGLEAMGQSYDPFFKGIARAQLEVMGLMSRRAQAYLEIPNRFSHCRTPQDIASEQLRFWRTAYDEYAQSMGRITGAMASVTTPPFGFTVPDDEAESAHDYITFPEPTGTEERSRSGRSKQRGAARAA
jgi:Phasin protein